MKFVYTICYPDKEEIDVFERIIDGQEVINIFSSFDFNAELRKPREYFSPSIDFIRLSDKKRIVFSGLGKRRLREFQVTYIIPSNPDFTNVFNKKNYLGSTEHTKIVSVSKASEILQWFIGSEDVKIVEWGRKIKSTNDVEINKKVIKSKIKPQNKSKIKSKTKRKSIGDSPLYKTIVTIIFKILGVGLVMFFAAFSYVGYKYGGLLDFPTLLFGALAVLFIVVTIKFKIDFDNL